MTNDDLTRTEAAEVLGVHPATLCNWAVWNQGPPFVRDGRRTIYKRADVLAYVEKRNEKRAR